MDKKTPFEIVVDTQEKTPFSFKNVKRDVSEGGGLWDVQTIRKSLPTADYSLVGQEDRIAIERKSLSDLYSTISQGRERFERELSRLQEMKFACVIVEADWKRILLEPPEKSKLTPKTVFRSILAWCVRYPLVHWFCMTDRRLAELTTFRLLFRCHKEQAKSVK